jgi:molecular chaperone DnaJ
MSDHNYYRVLGLDLNATRSDIRRSFRMLAMRYHPDQNPGDPDAEERFKLITQAYKTLVDPRKRARYDRTRGPSLNQRDREKTTSRRRNPNSHPDVSGDEEAPHTNAAPSSTTGAEEKPARKPWWAEEKPLRPTPPPPSPEEESLDGRDLEVDMTISSEMAETGGRQPLAISRQGHCVTCGGTGAKAGTPVRRCPECHPQNPSPTCPLCLGRGHMVEAFCPACFGRGQARVTRKIEITIPARVQAGQKIRVPGEGLPGQKGGKPGDLIVRVSVRQQPQYEQRDSSVFSEIHVTPSMTAMGGVVRVKTLDGWAELTIPAGTRSGTIFRLEGKGPALQNGDHGDHFVTVKIVAI